MALKEKVAEIVEDIATLDVLTLTGELTLTEPKTENGRSRLDLSELYEALVQATQKRTQGGTEVAATLEVVAFTHIDFDKDVCQFVKSNPDEAILKSHRDMVQASQDARRAVIEMAANVFAL